MRHFLASILLLAAPAMADSIARQGSDWVRLTLQPCEGKAAEAVKKMERDPLSFRAGVGHFGGQDYSLCWIPVSGGAALQYEDGDAGFIPMGDLKAAPQA